MTITPRDYMDSTWQGQVDWLIFTMAIIRVDAVTFSDLTLLFSIKMLIAS